MPTFRSNIVTCTVGTAAPPTSSVSFLNSNGVIEFGAVDHSAHLVAWRNTGGPATAITGGTMDIYGFYDSTPGWVKVKHLTHTDFTASRVKDIPLDESLMGYTYLCIRQRSGKALKIQVVADRRQPTIVSK